MEEKKVSNRDVALRKISDKIDTQFTVSMKGIFRGLKRFLALWIALSVIISLLTFAVIAYSKQDTYKKMTSLISFTFDGVEKGLDPNGNKFYVNSIKSEEIVKKALDMTGLPVEKCEDVRRCITFEGIIPQNAIERITSYTNVFSGNGAIATSEQISDVSYYPTQYRVHFDYAPVEFSGTEAADFLNNMLECYHQYFFDAYGYNQSLGDSLNAFNYQDYDYAEAVDVFDTSLTKLSTYISQVASTDTTRFRSKETDKTFADLTDAIAFLKETDLDTIASYVTINTVTKDKETLLTYYMYKVEELQRHLTVCNETLATVTDSINNYKKNTVMVFGTNGDKDSSISASEASEEYDKLFDRKNSIQKDLSTTAQEISLYNKRIERLNSSTQSNSAEKKAYVEEKLARLNTKTEELIDFVYRTTDDYYRTVVFPKAYNVLVPAEASFITIVKHAVKDSMMAVLILDALIFVLYLGAAVVFACKEEYRRLYGTAVSEKSSKKKEPKSAKKKKNSEADNKEEE